VALGRLAAKHFLKMTIPLWNKREIIGLPFLIPVRENIETFFVE